jgi:glycosyltransferase involved in cell wall biosynthesis
MFIFYTIPYVIMYRDRTVGVVIPAYNEEALIKHTLDSIPPYVDKVYPVDDCSTDLTSDIILKHDDKRISPLLHETNQGVGAAIFTGYRAALKDDIDMIAVMAGDNQMDPVHLPLLLDEIIDNDIHYAKGNRLKENGHRCGMSMWRFLGNYILSVLTKFPQDVGISQIHKTGIPSSRPRSFAPSTSMRSIHGMGTAMTFSCS